MAKREKVAQESGIEINIPPYMKPLISQIPNGLMSPAVQQMTTSLLTSRPEMQMVTKKNAQDPTAEAGSAEQPVLSTPSPMPNLVVSEAGAPPSLSPKSVNPSPTSSALNKLEEKWVNDKSRMIRKITADMVMPWDADRLSLFLRENFLNIGSEAIRTIREKEVTGKMFLELTRKECVDMLGSERVGDMLHRLVLYVKSE
ncbi:unnamed protein product [Caenorhabditis bovis]|nr:unnamed protein product [Caenorhabditis bovis]